MNKSFKLLYQLLTIIFSGSLIGFGIFAITNHWIIFNVPLFKSKNVEGLSHSIATIKKKETIKLYLPRKKNKNEEISILLSPNDNANAYTISTAWLAKVNEEGLLQKHTTVQSVAITKDGQQLLISFDRPPFNKQASIDSKLTFLESLSKTLAPHIPTLRSILWLVHHKPLIDYHFDCAISWPIQEFPSLQKEQIKKNLPLTTKNKTITIMLDPAGDAGNKGRLIDGTFERGISLQIAERLKKQLEKETSYRIILTRFPGERIEPLQNATFSNRLHADFFISLHFFYTPHEPAQWFLYYYTLNPITDSWTQKQSTWSTVHTIYRTHIQATKKCAWSLYEELRKLIQNSCAIYPPKGIPLRPLVGLNSPSLAIEIGLPPNNSLEHIIQPLAESIKKTIVKLVKDGTTNSRG